MRRNSSVCQRKSKSFYLQKITKVSDTTVRIQKNQTTYPLKNIGNRWFRYFDMRPVFGFYFIDQEIFCFKGS
ncbi:hypothetical protein CKL83_28905 [Bacillus anthracis]|uniref:Uncharacterized protein n=1 Tax=Bacillus cereus (strain 03BB102) TaxID=572264 RepID=A0A125Y9T3_BACC3|nr:conserved hypothetical protein [Bacillus cereus 03BB102]APT29205.1 hypothetical protein BVB96_29645 [Bacillus anthracis]ARO21660.1 hypothetical protein B2J90_30095 [Bacillus cereus]AQM49683.1 hypothetical protein BZG08_29900 [Bacillus anthracis]OON42727.1 hypothetical protein B0R37_30525 [Bacillus anthracis]